MSAALPPGEIKALARILDDLDYYEILGLARDSDPSEVRRAYHVVSRRFHPDVHRTLSGDSRAALLRVAKRVTEAYSVLRSPRRRKVYDERLDSAQRPVRMQLAEARAEVERKAVVERMGATPNGRRFFAMAEADAGRGDLASAQRNLQMALTFEPANRRFKETLERIRERLK